MIDVIRAFVAVELPVGVTEHIRHLVDPLRRQLFPMVRWVQPEGIHLTLKFLGGVRVAQIDAILDSLTEVASAQRSFHLHLENAGAFPSLKAPRVLWLGLGGDVGRLAHLHRCLEEAMVGLDFPKEQRSFAAHLTLGRINGRLLALAQDNLITSLRAMPVNKALGIPVGEIGLVRSIMMDSGVTYRCIGRGTLQADLPD